MFKKLLIANRGEIACRIMKTAQTMGIKTIAVYTKIEQQALHVQLADEAVCIGDAEAETSYLNVQALIQAAQTTQAEAIHPGYGFLSESPLLAKACKAHHITFIGPDITILEMMGSKQKAKAMLTKIKVPLIPGYHGQQQSEAALKKAARHLQPPLLIKAAAGGGGKGMRIVTDLKQLDVAIQSAKREAKAYFGDETLILEKYIPDARHIEVQMIGDEFGHIYHLFDRDCSIQRKHQKLIEEAPAPYLSPHLRKKILKVACHIAKTIHYVGVGTIEFLVTPDKTFYFMEMNTRLQVEHPVTESILGLDLVAWQLRIANHEVLPTPFATLQPQGHAIECRLYAETPRLPLPLDMDAAMPSQPTLDFIAVSGDFKIMQQPTDLHLRIDTGYTKEDTLSPYYDALIMKLIAHGPSRAHALKTLYHALQQCMIIGIPTNITFLQAILAHPDFKKGHLSTDFIQQHTWHEILAIPFPAKLFTLAYEYVKTTSLPLIDQSCFAFHPFTPLTWRSTYQDSHALITPDTQHTCWVSLENKMIFLTISHQDDVWHITDTTQSYTARLFSYPPYLYCFYEGKLYTFEKRKTALTATSDQAYVSPMPGKVISILKQPGEMTNKNEGVIIIEAMKMEHTICSAEAGMIEAIFYQKGEKVTEGDVLFTLKAHDETPSSS